MTNDMLEKPVFDLAEILPHLPADKQVELSRALCIIFEEFEDARAMATSDLKRMGRIFHVILFGSFTGDKWVEDPKSGYMSDFDLLIVVSHDHFTDYGTYWYKAEERILRHPAIQREVNFIVHDHGDINRQLEKRQYFFSDIVREGIPLYELTQTKKLVNPAKLDENEAKKQANSYFEQSLPKISGAIKGANFHVAEGDMNWAAFMLHQAVESTYNCLLLTHTLYSPPSHNIKLLRSLAEKQDASLIDAWPRASKANRATFALLKRAYIDARYSPKYEITKDQLNWLMDRVKDLEARVKQSCEAKLTN